MIKFGLKVSPSCKLRKLVALDQELRRRKRHPGRLFAQDPREGSDLDRGEKGTGLPRKGQRKGCNRGRFCRTMTAVVRHYKTEYTRSNPSSRELSELASDEEYEEIEEEMPYDDEITWGELIANCYYSFINLAITLGSMGLLMTAYWIYKWGHVGFVPPHSLALSLSPKPSDFPMGLQATMATRSPCFST